MLLIIGLLIALLAVLLAVTILNGNMDAAKKHMHERTHVN